MKMFRPTVMFIVLVLGGMSIFFATIDEIPMAGVALGAITIALTNLTEK